MQGSEAAAFRRAPVADLNSRSGYAPGILGRENEEDGVC
jgi:hypothetical protein